MVTGASLLFFIALLVIFFISPRHFFAASIISRAMANILVSVKVLSIGGSTFSFPDILAIFTLLFGIGYSLGKWRILFVNPLLRIIILSILLFIFFTGLASVTDGVKGLIEVAKLTSWLIYLPLGYILFSDREGIKLLKKTGVIAALVIVGGLVIGHFLRLGDTSYDLGILYLGFFSSEASMTSALFASLVFFFLPEVTDKSGNLKGFFHKVVILVLFGLIVLVMVRTTIISVFILLVVYTLLKSSSGFIKKITAVTGVGVLFIAIVAGVVISNPKFIEVRFKDVKTYQEGGSATSLGSGRVSLFDDYYKEYRSQSVLTQLFGADFYTNSDQSISSTFKSTQVGTHNDILQILFLSGLVGLIFYASIWISIILAVRRSFKLPLEEYHRQIVALSVGLICTYGIFIFHGVLFHIYLMQTIAVIIGTTLGSSYQAFLEQNDTDDSKGGISNDKTKSIIYRKL